MNDLRAYFEANPGRRIHKWTHYFEIYERHLARFRDTAITVVEFGVSHGGSLQMWKHYFGAAARIVGVDIDPRCQALKEEGVEVVIGDQADRAFLRRFRERLGTIDILIDDGGHLMEQQIATFEELFPHLAANGVYVVEDLHTSYWPGYGGGLGRRGTFIEYSKRLIDELHAWHWREEGIVSKLRSRLLGWRPSLEAPRVRTEGLSRFTRSAGSMHYYDSMLVIEKRLVFPPERRITGTLAWK